MKGDGSLGVGGKRGGVKVISRLLLEPGLEDVEEKKGLSSAVYWC